LFTISTVILLLSTCILSGIKPLLAENNNSGPLINPIADANGPYYGIINQPIFFNGSNSYDPDGTIIYYEWCCGDGNAIPGKIASHIYSNTGRFKLLLIVVDNEGNLDTDETDVIIEEDSPPMIELINPMRNSFYFRNYYLIDLDNKTIIYGSTNVSVHVDDDVGINRVEFYLDDSLQFTDYTEPYNWVIPKGHFKHKLEVIAYDIVGQQSNDQIDFIQWKSHPFIIILFLSRLIINQNLDLKWIKDENQWNSLLLRILENLRDNDLKNDDLNNIIEFFKKSTDKIKTKIIINFLNNHPYFKDKFRKNYPLMYLVLFYIKNEDSLLKEKILHEFYNNHNLINILFSIKTIQDNSKYSGSIIEDLLDSKPIQWMKDHPLLTFGILLILLLLTTQMLSDEGNTEDNSNEENIENKEPIAIITGPISGIINSPINFSAENSYDEDGKIMEYNWNFGDGTSSSGIKVQHTYLLPGSYKITLSIVDDNGETTYDYLNIEIKNNYNIDEQKNDIQNMEYLIISGILSTILLIGLIILKIRRNFFE
jgi:PKD repeat protein